MVGIKDKKLSEQLQLDPKLTLEKAITKTKQSEAVKKQQTFLQETKSHPPPAKVTGLEHCNLLLIIEKQLLLVLSLQNYNT